MATRRVMFDKWVNSATRVFGDSVGSSESGGKASANRLWDEGRNGSLEDWRERLSSSLDKRERDAASVEVSTACLAVSESSWACMLESVPFALEGETRAVSRSRALTRLLLRLTSRCLWSSFDVLTIQTSAVWMTVRNDDETDAVQCLTCRAGTRGGLL